MTQYQGSKGKSATSDVQAPTLGYELDSFQVQALDELGWNTMSPSNADNAAAAGLVTSCEVAGVGINPPYLPGHECMLPGVTAGINLRICSSDDTTSHQQSFTAAACAGDCVVFLQVLAQGILIRLTC